MHFPTLDSGIMLGFPKDKVIFLKLQASVSEIYFSKDWFFSSCLLGFPSLGKGGCATQTLSIPAFLMAYG